MSKLEVRLLEPALCRSFPGKPTCLAYDTEEKYIAVGCDNGKVSVLSKSGRLSGQVKVLSHDRPKPVKLMSFCHEKVNGETFLMTTLEGNPTLFLWSFTDESKCVSQTALGSEVTVLTWSSRFSLFYVGTKDGDVLGLTIMTSENDYVTLEFSKPLIKKEPNDDCGRVVAVKESKEKGLLLIVFSSGLCLVREGKSEVPYFILKDEIPIAAWWKKSEESFNISCKSGNLISCNSKGKVADPVPVGKDGITKVKRFFSTATKELYIASYAGGAPGAVPKEYRRSHLITMFHGSEKNSDTNALEEFGSNVVDFVFLPSEKEQSNKPLLAVLTESELVLLDTSEREKNKSGTIRYSQSTNSYPVMTSSVTSLQFCGECSQEFMVKIKHQTKEGEVPQLLVTGHSDGSVRLWLGYCNDGSLSFELLHHLTVYTERYFEHFQSEEPKQKKLSGVTSYAKVIDSRYLLVIKNTERVLLFSLIHENDTTKPHSQEIFLREGYCGSPNPSETLEIPPPHFRPHQPHKYVQLLQHFSCHYQSGPDQPLVPVNVNCAVYNGQMEMLAVGTKYCLVVVDVKTNMLVQVIRSENKLLKLSLGQNNDIPGCSQKNCDVVCLEALKVSWKEDEEAQHTLLVGTRGENGTMGSLKITRKVEQVLELEPTELGKVYKKSALREIHFYQKEKFKFLETTSDRRTAEFKDEGEELILYITAHVAVITEKLLKTYQIPGLAINSKDFPASIIWSGLVQNNGKPFIVYVTKDRHKLAGFCLTDFRSTISKNLPAGCHPVEQDLFSSNGKHAIMKCSDQFYYITDSF